MALRLTAAGLAMTAATPIHVAHGERTGGFAGHCHDFMEVVLVAAGTGVHVTATGETPLVPGSVLVLRPGAWHAYVRCQALRLWDCCFPAALLDRELAWLVDYPEVRWLLWQGPLTGGGILQAALAVSALPRCEADLGGLSRVAAGERLPAIVALTQVLAAVAGGCGRDASRQAVPPVVGRALAMLADDPARSWTATGVARVLGVDPAYLSRAVSKAVGQPPMAYLTRLRAERAAVLLATTDDPVAAIAARVGWGDPVQFARRFRACFGMTASDYRRRRSAAGAG